MKISKILFFLILLFGIAENVFSIEYNKALITQNFSTPTGAVALSMQGCEILFNDAALVLSNPASFEDITKNLISFNTSSYYSSFYSAEQLLYVYAKDSLSRLSFALSRIDYGEWYDTRSLEKDAIYDDNGELTTDSIGYWDDSKVVKRQANDFIFNFVYNKRILNELVVGAKLNTLINSYELTTNVGSSIDISALYTTNSLLFTLIVNSIGAGVIGNSTNKEIDYEYMHLQLGARYRKLIRGRADTYFDLLISHNALFLDNTDITVGTNLRIRNVFDIYGSYNIKDKLNDDYFEYKKYGIGVGINFKYIEVKYSQLFDSYTTITNNLSFTTRF